MFEVPISAQFCILHVVFSGILTKNYFKVSETMNRLIAENSDVADTLDKVYRLHAINTIQNKLTDLTLSGIISLEEAQGVSTYEINQLPVRGTISAKIIFELFLR